MKNETTTQITVNPHTEGLGFAYAIGTIDAVPAEPTEPTFFGYEGVVQGFDELTDRVQALSGVYYAYRVFVDGKALFMQSGILDLIEGDSVDTYFV